MAASFLEVLFSPLEHRSTHGNEVCLCPNFVPVHDGPGGYLQLNGQDGTLTILHFIWGHASASTNRCSICPQHGMQILHPFLFASGHLCQSVDNWAMATLNYSIRLRVIR